MAASDVTCNYGELEATWSHRYPQRQVPNSAQPDHHALIKILRTAGYSPLLFKTIGNIWVVLYMNIMNLFFLELFVYTEASLNAISPILLETSTIILTVSLILNVFCSTKICRHRNRGHECLSRVLRGPKYKEARLYVEFSKTYPFSNSVIVSL